MTGASGYLVRGDLASLDTLRNEGAEADIVLHFATAYNLRRCVGQAGMGLARIEIALVAAEEKSARGHRIKADEEALGRNPFCNSTIDSALNPFFILS
nr:uncharacterized protein CTRU02_14845 [Colletotrichum truncatum]KAF6781748.1 hypothetical protein CTRU02_14845 [Colletotrichum truncatum]